MGPSEKKDHNDKNSRHHRRYKSVFSVHFIVDILKKYKIFVATFIILVLLFSFYNTEDGISIINGYDISNNDDDAYDNDNDENVFRPENQYNQVNNNLFDGEDDDDFFEALGGENIDTLDNIRDITVDLVEYDGLDEDVAIERALNITKKLEYQRLQNINKSVDYEINKWNSSKLAKENPNMTIKDTLMGSIMQSMGNRGYRPKACILMYISDYKMDDIITTIKSMQLRFNDWANYPWIFISATGIEYSDAMWVDEITNYLPENQFKFATADKGMFWTVPDWIDPTKAAKGRSKLRTVPNGDSQFHKLLTRYFTGLFYKESFLNDFDWYWKIEPGMQLFCDIDFDPFRMMQDEQKLFGTASSVKENAKTVDNIVKLMETFKKDDKIYISEGNYEKFIENKEEKDPRRKYDRCSFSTSNEIVNLNLWRSRPFEEFYNSIDISGGIFYDGWSIDLIHTMAVTHLAKKDHLKYFSELGYRDSNFINCPIDDEKYRNGRCHCDPGEDMTFNKNSCLVKIYDDFRLDKPDNWGKHKDLGF